MLRSNHLQPGISLNTIFPTADLTLKVSEFDLCKDKATCIFCGAETTHWSNCDESIIETTNFLID